jgi:hypothetical protein
MFKKIELKNYQRSNSQKLDSVIRSVNIEKRHIAFISKNRINLSEFVRDCLDNLIQSEPTKRQAK